MEKCILEKYHGLGNDYLVLDPNLNSIELTEEKIKKICNRNFGVGSDGILYGPILKDNKIKVRIFNPDGSEAEKSGNGVRIFSKYLLDKGYVKEKTFILSTLGGEVKVEYLDKAGEKIKVAMGKVTFESEEIPVSGEKRKVINETFNFKGKEYKATCLSIGNPHCVIPMKNISKNLAESLGPYVENYKEFPNKINMQLLEVIDRNNIKIEIYERGAGYTLASGSSSCAAASAAYELGLINNKVKVHMPGGILDIEILQDKMVYMTGPVEYICHIEMLTKNNI
ncbi:MAG: diaminopimelate epimerase [Clostridium sp.]|nr:diaminopimelate epimerase [Clostridium sp.]